MASAASFEVQQDGTFDLDEGERKELSVDVPADQLAARSLIVACRARPLSGDGDDDFVEISLQ
jgi:hypothetical protein